MSKEFSTPYFPELKLEGIHRMLDHFSEDTRQFFIDCIETGAMNEVPRDVDEEEWNESLYLLFRFALTAESKLSLVRYLGVGRYGFDRRMDHTVRSLWENLPPYVQKTYDLEMLSFEKSLLEKTKKMQRQIEEWKKSGLSPDEILDRLGVSNTILSQRRDILRKKYGIEIETLYARSKFKNNKIAEELPKATDDETIQSLLNMINRGAYSRFVLSPDPPVILSIKRCIPKDFHFAGSEIMEFIHVVVESDIPVGHIFYENKTDPQARPQAYFFVAAQHKQRVEHLLLHEPSLEKYKKNPVKQFAGPAQSELPATTVLIHKIGYESLSSVLGKRSVLVKKIFDERCPVPIYKSGKVLYFSVADEPQLLEYLEMRVKELRHSSDESNE